MKKFKINNKDIFNAEHPARRKAIRILEHIAEYLGKPTIFDCKKGNTRWYDLEDRITEMILEKE